MLRKLDLVREKDKMKSLEVEMPEMKEVDVGSQEAEKLKAYLKGSKLGSYMIDKKN